MNADYLYTYTNYKNIRVYPSKSAFIRVIISLCSSVVNQADSGL